MKRPRKYRPFTLVFRGLCFLCMITPALSQDSPHSFSLWSHIVSSSQVFLNPFASLSSDRNTAIDLGTTFSAGFSYSYSLSPSARTRISFEYIPNEERMRDNNGTEFVHGFRIYAIEACGLFTLPFTGDVFQVYLGGGGGVYFGSRQYSVAGIESRILESNPGFGILTLIGLRYAITCSIAVSGEILFRDPQITTRNVFDQPGIFYNGVYYHLDTQSTPAKVNLNGNVYSLGISYSF